MTDAAPHPQLPAPLKLLQQQLPGELYLLASREQIIQAGEKCGDIMAVRAEWDSSEKSILTLHCLDGVSVTISEYGRISIYCDCQHWTPHSQCPHAIIIWIQLKRLLSPDTFPHLKIDSRVLMELAELIGIPELAPAEQPELYHDHRLLPLMGKYGLSYASNLLQSDRPRPDVVPIDRKNIRLVLEYGNGRLRGSMRHGQQQLNRWTAGLPSDVIECLLRLPFFESKIHYFSSFLSITGGAYPVVFVDAAGRETSLAVRAKVAHRACLVFVLGPDSVEISRTIDGNLPVTEQVITSNELLLDLQQGTIHPLKNREVWTVWENIQDNLLNTEEYDEALEWEYSADPDYYPPDTDDPYFRQPVEAGRDAGRIVVSLEEFNSLALRLDPDAIADFSSSLFFFHNSAPCEIVATQPPLYLLQLPADLDSPSVGMLPMVACNSRLYTFSRELFRFFDPNFRSGFSAPIRAKKRVRTIIETFFEMAGATTATARKAVIKDALSGPDYAKRSIKSEARRLLSGMAEHAAAKPLMIQASGEGWLFARDDRKEQVALLRILYDMFGVEAFDGGGRPAEMRVRRDELLRQLPGLAGQLQKAGFLLLMGREPLTSAVWDFALDATASSLDWFELKPEIRCDGELLNDEELQQLAVAGILQRDGRVILIDDISARILAMLAGAVSGGKRKKKGGAQAARIPRLQILDWLQLRRHGVEVRLAPEEDAVLESLVNFASIPERALPPGLTAVLRPYQRDGYRWLGFLYEHRFGACLADDMGLGKTVQGISLLAGLAGTTVVSRVEGSAPHLIVVPPSLLFNWESELARFFPAAALLSYTGAGRSTAAFAGCDIIITSYGIVQRDIDKLAEFRFNVIIFDEAQIVKNLQAATSMAVRRLSGAFKLALTGTPVENRIEEYYAIMDLCLPGLLGTPEEFGRMIANRGQGGIDTLSGRTRPFVLRRNKQLIAADLPDKIETDIHLELSARQKVYYQRTVEEVRKQIDEAFSSRAPGQARIIALTAILRLRQICLSPALALPGASETSPKLEFLLEQLDELRDEGHSALVFSQFTSYLDIVESGLKRHGFSCLRLDGSTPVASRKDLVNSFQNSGTPLVFLISLKAGGKGLNLTRATYVYHLDPWWNPAVENQASDRAHRIGQTRQVTITRLIMRHTIEEKMMALKDQKLKLYRAILDEGVAGGGAGLTREDFEFLLG